MGRPKLIPPDPNDVNVARMPAMCPEIREMQMINLATEVAEQQMRNGTASPSVICHYLKLGSMREKTELEKLRIDKELQLAKIEAIKQAGDIETMYREAMAAMTNYRGSVDAVNSDEDEDVNCYDE